MLFTRAYVRHLVLLMSILLLTACGGGGGDSGPSTDGSLTLSVSSLSFSAKSGGTLPATNYFSFSSSNPEATQILIGVPAGSTKPSWLSYGISGSQLWVKIVSTNLSAGTYKATIRVATARSNNTLVDIKDIPLTYTVSAATVATPGSLNFSAVEGETPPMQSFTLSQGGVGVTPLTAAEQTSNWFDIVINGNTVEVTPNATATAKTQGSYSTNIRVTTSDDSLTISVNYAVSGKKLTTSSLSTFQINSSTQLDQLSQDLTIGSNFVGGTANWSANVNVPWVTLSAVTGDTTTNNILAVSINTSQLADLKNIRNTSGDVVNHQATITFSSTTVGVSSVAVNLFLGLNLPYVEYVSPHVAVSGTTEEIILRGSAFSQITNETLNCGTQTASSYVVNSDVEMRVVCPALTSGTYEMELLNKLNINRNHAVLNVVDGAGYAAEVISSTGTKSRIIYDPVRESVYIADIQNGLIESYKYDNTILAGSKWGVSSSVYISGLSDIALSTDGSYLYSVSSDTGRYFNEINPDSLEIDRAVSWGGLAGINSVAFLNGGDAIQTFDFSGKTINAIRIKRNSAGSYIWPQILNAVVGKSRDGRRGLIASQDANPAVAVYYLDAAAEPFMSSPTLPASSLTRNASNISSDRTGSKWVLDHTAIYSNTFLSLFNLPVTTQSSLLSHDGLFAYTVDSNGSIRKFNLSDFSEIGTGTTLATTPGANPVMTMSHDGGRLFIAGDQNFIIMATP